MSYGTSPGRNLLTTLMSWLIALLVGSIVVQILMAELVRWVSVLAPWVLLTLVFAVVGLAVVAVLRRRSCGY